MPRVKKAITQIRAATMARMNSHLITTTARTPVRRARPARSGVGAWFAACPAPWIAKPPNSGHGRVLDRDHRRDRPALDLLRRLLEPVHPVVTAVEDVDDALRDQLRSRLAARDELGEAVRGPARGSEAVLQLP